MAAGLTGIENLLSATHAHAAAKPMDSQTIGTNDDTGSASATIGANDFLTLLVTEMKNQDPTANTDPNEYINQLVQVNSLEQLISINQTLTADSTPSTSDHARTQPEENAHSISAISSKVAVLTQADGPKYHSDSQFMKQAAGNLSVPAADPAAMRVARSLSNY